MRARELVRLADRTRREVASATSAGRLRVLATAACAEHVAGAALAAFTRRVPRVAVDLNVGSAECAAAALGDDSADIALGIRLAAPGQVFESVPFLRYQRVVVAGPGHPRAGTGPVPPAELAHLPWLAGPAGFEPGSEEEAWARAAGRPLDVERCESENQARDRARAGAGLLLALGHAVREDLRRGSLVRLPVAGTPVTGMWWASVPGEGRATVAARALQRFLVTPDATTALLDGPVPGKRARPVRVELWS